MNLTNIKKCICRKFLFIEKEIKEGVCKDCKKKRNEILKACKWRNREGGFFDDSGVGDNFTWHGFLIILQ